MNCIVFAGSSSFTKWKGMSDSFPGYPVVNRGFGGSSIPDLIRYADEIIIKYHPRQVIIYSGDNDIAFNNNITAQILLSRFSELFTLIRNKLPEVQITIMSIKPSPKRWEYDPLMVETNRLINNFISQQSNALFVNVHDAMLTADGNVNSSLFVEDSFHMNPKGYAIWTEKLKPVLLH